MPPIFIFPMPTVRTQSAAQERAQGSGAPGRQGSQQGGGAGSNTGPVGGRPGGSRPPWVKEGPEPLPMPSAPWAARARDRRTSRDEPPAEPPKADPPRKQSKITIVPSQPQPQENGVDAHVFKKDVVSAAAAKKTQPKEEAAKEHKISIQVESKQRPPAKQEPKPMPKPEPKPEPKREAKPEPKREPRPASRPEPKTPASREMKQEPKPPVSMPPKPPKEPAAPPKPRHPVVEPEPFPVPLQRSRTSSHALAPPPPPPRPPPPPPPPDFQKSPLSKTQEQKLEVLRSGRAMRKRPDWGAMMKEVESGRKLRHVQCNDRSSPLLPMAKVKGQFMYDSEKPNVHNQLLREIQSGVNLKRVQTNDRSRPVLEGLRKFRRQLTIEEQAQVKEVEAQVTEELDDIDSLRDDLQSTKQMLALELRNKEAVEKENKRLQARILNIEVELEQERARIKEVAVGGAKKSSNDKDLQELRGQLSDAAKKKSELEQCVHESNLLADQMRAELEEMRLRNAALERRLSQTAKGTPADYKTSTERVSRLGHNIFLDADDEQPLMKQPSAKKIAAAAAGGGGVGRRQEPEDEEEEETEEEETETESEEENSSDDEEKKAALREKRNAREIKLLTTKVRALKEKEDVVRKERHALRLQLKNQNKALREEKKKFKKLQKEVDKMAKLMKDDEAEDEDDEEKEEEEEEEEEEESESESEESSSEEEEESDGELPETAPFDQRKKNFTDRAKRHENILAALKKGNYLLKANVEKIKDDLFKQKELSLSLQEDLNSVLAELG